MNQEVEKKLKAQRKQEKQRIKQYGKIYSQALAKDQSNEYLQSMKNGGTGSVNKRQSSSSISKERKKK